MTYRRNKKIYTKLYKFLKTFDRKKTVILLQYKAISTKRLYGDQRGKVA